MALATLQAIRTKVRRLTRSPTINTLSDSDIDQYVNTFVLYDFPQHVKLYNLRTTFTFYTQPNVDVYSTVPTDTTNPLYDFNNKILAIHPQVYIAGVPVYYTQNRDEFFGTYPLFNAITNQVAIANGTTGPFTGSINASPNLTSSQNSNPAPILQNNVIFSTIGINNVAMTLVDYPVATNTNNAEGFLFTPNAQVPVDIFNALGVINYLTGEFTFNFPNNTVNGANITSETIPYQPGKPYAILYYAQEFTIRPVPDKVYSVEMQVDIRPTELLNINQAPDLEQWWQYIAYGAAKKVFEDRSDLDSVQLIMPEFKKQEQLVLMSTATIMANQRSKTIYNQGTGLGRGWGWGPLGWPF